MSQGHLPQYKRALPKEYYGAFDIQITPDGSKRYMLPNTLLGSALRMSFTPGGILSLLGAAAVLALVNGPDSYYHYLEDKARYMALALIPLHLALTITLCIGFAITGYRTGNSITIRRDGLILNDHLFYPREHIYAVIFGTTTSQQGKAERFVPHISIQLGTTEVLLIEELDDTSAQLFQRFFAEDMRHYWDGQN